MRGWIDFGSEYSPWDRRVAYLCAIAYLLAGVGIITWISPGYVIEANAVPSLEFVNQSRGYWRLGWTLVLFATTLQMIFFGVVTNRIRPSAGPFGHTVLIVGGFGIITAWMCALISIIHMPALAEINMGRPLGQIYTFHTLLRRLDTYLFSVGNTFLWASGLLLNFLCLRDPRFPRWLFVVGLPVWAAGASMSLLSSSTLRISGLSFYIPLFALWAFLVGFFYLDTEDQVPVRDQSSRALTSR